MRGDGPPLVAPAWWVSHLELDWQSPDVRRFWEGVAKDHTLIRYDRVGVGMSDRTVRDFDLTLDGEVATLRTLLDELDLDRITLIGGSPGTCTAIAFAASFPERIERLVLYGSYPHGDALTPPGVADAIVAAVVRVEPAYRAPPRREHTPQARSPVPDGRRRRGRASRALVR